jgi:SET domain-containing protein
MGKTSSHYRIIENLRGGKRAIRGFPKHIKHESAHYRLRIGRSRIHKLGVFALEDIPEGQGVIEYTGRHLTLDQAFSLGFTAPREDYLLVASRKSVIDGGVGGSGAEFINHSCNPNLTWLCRQGRLYFYSLRSIRAGEELTLYYSHPTRARRIPCACGARNCRKTLRYVLVETDSMENERKPNRTVLRSRRRSAGG